MQSLSRNLLKKMVFVQFIQYIRISNTNLHYFCSLIKEGIKFFENPDITMTIL